MIVLKKVVEKGGSRNISRETEKIFKEMQEFLKNHDENNRTDADTESLIEEFMKHYNGRAAGKVSEPETSDDYFELAFYADDEKNALKYANKALALDPNNFDAKALVLELKAKDRTELVRTYEKAVQKATKYMAEKGYFKDDCIGDFWKILETRSYMRLRASFAENLIKCGKMGQAREECRELLRLCDGDNLGIRYYLMHIYAYFEEEEAAHALHKHFDLCNETQMLFPLSILHYKKGNYAKATQYLRKLNGVNKDLKKFLQIFSEDLFELFEEYEVEDGYLPNTIEEFIVELNENLFLFATTNYYPEWALKQVKKFK